VGDFTDQFICKTFQKVLHINDDNYLENGTGSLVQPNGLGIDVYGENTIINTYTQGINFIGDGVTTTNSGSIVNVHISSSIEPSSSLWKQAEDFIYYDSGSVYVYEEMGSNQTSIRTHNETGLQIIQEKIVRINGYHTNNNTPTISLVDNYSYKPLGILTKNINDGVTDFILTRGTLQTSFPTNTANIGEIIYTDDNGNLTLTQTIYPVGQVANKTGVIYFDFSLNNSNSIQTLEGHGNPNGVITATQPTQLYLNLDGTDGTNYTLWGWSDNDSSNMWKPIHLDCSTEQLDKTINSSATNETTLN